MGVFRISSTEMICAFQEDEYQPQHMHMKVLPGAGLDLSKLAMVGELVDMLEAGEISLSEGSDRLDQIGKTSVPWGKIARGPVMPLLEPGLPCSSP